MKVFISWSGEPSLQVATALRDWLPSVIQAVKPFLSQEDISAGEKWDGRLFSQLNECKAGIICLAPNNLTAPWLHFEAGALANRVEKIFVCPYLYGLNKPDVTRPMADFQMMLANREDTQRLARAINDALDQKLPAASLDRSFDLWWPHLERVLSGIPTPEHAAAQRSTREILEEILELVRRQSRLRVINNVRTLLPGVKGDLPTKIPLADIQKRLNALRCDIEAWTTVHEEIPPTPPPPERATPSHAPGSPPDTPSES